MSDKNEISPTNSHYFCPIVQRHELIAHLNNFQRDINRYMHSLPAVAFGIPSGNLISSAFTLNYNIECYRNTVADVMTREGLDLDKPEPIPTIQVRQDLCHSPNTVRRLFNQRILPGSIPPLMPIGPNIAQNLNTAVIKPAAFKAPSQKPTFPMAQNKNFAKGPRLPDQNAIFSGTYSQHVERENAAMMQHVSQSSTPNGQ